MMKTQTRSRRHLNSINIAVRQCIDNNMPEDSTKLRLRNSEIMKT